MNGETQVKLSLGIGLCNCEQDDIQDLEELVPNWAELNKEELKEALHKAWVEWAWDYIDGCAQILDDEGEDED